MTGMHIKFKWTDNWTIQKHLTISAWVINLITHAQDTRTYQWLKAEFFIIILSLLNEVFETLETMELYVKPILRHVSWQTVKSINFSEREDNLHN